MKDMIVKLDKYVFRAKNYTTYNNNRLCNLSDVLTCRGIRKKQLAVLWSREASFHLHVE